jgi:hypothetical protein
LEEDTSPALADYWNDGMMANQADAWLPAHLYSIIPLFHYSKIPNPVISIENDK